jgi:hypothetical protein
VFGKKREAGKTESLRRRCRRIKRLILPSHHPPDTEAVCGSVVVEKARRVCNLCGQVKRQQIARLVRSEPLGSCSGLKPNPALKRTCNGGADWLAFSISAAPLQAA